MMTLLENNSAAERIARQHPFPEDMAKKLATVLRVLGDDTRLRILYYLQREKEINVRTFCELVAQSQPAVSHHLALLKDAGLVDSRRDGKNNYYHLVPEKAREYLDELIGAPIQTATTLEIDNRVISYAQR